MILKIIVKNLWFKPLHTTLSALLLTLSTGIISLLLLMQHQLEQKFENDLKDIDMVLGAKGSPLQLVLSAVYHVDAPTGNIDWSDYEKIKRHPMVRQVVPLAYGDSYRSFRIVGTDSSYLQKYEAVCAVGRPFESDLEVVIGSNVATATGLKVGDTFQSTHGEAEQGEVHEHHPYTVSGILAPTQTVLDQLITCSVGSVWKMHEPTAETGDAHAHMGEHEHEHEHEHAHEHAEAQNPDSTERELTALLVKFRSPMGIMTLPRMVNETTQMQAAVPALEINRLLGLMGIGIAALQALAFAIMVISGMSVFIALYNRLRERRYELALLRAMGCSKIRLFQMLIGEGLLLAAIGFAGGVLLSRTGIALLNRATPDLHFTFRYQWISAEYGLLGATLAVGLLAALIPAWKAYRMDVAAALNASG